MDLQTAIQNDILGRNLEVRIEIILAGMCLAFLYGCLTNWIYKKTHHGVNYVKSFSYALIVMPVIICTIMIAIGSSISLSLGLVGSLSIIRFRTAVRDVRDMVYIFSTVAVGLSCGSGNFVLATLGCAFFLIVSLLVSHFSKITQLNDDYLLTVVATKTAWESAKIEEALTQLCQSWKQKSMLITESNHVEMSCSMVMHNHKSLAELLMELQTRLGEGSEVKAIAPDSTVLF